MSLVLLGVISVNREFYTTVASSWVRFSVSGKHLYRLNRAVLHSLRYIHSLMEILEFLDKNPDDQSVLET